MGIDPGLEGAVAVILPAGAEAHVTPTIAAAGGGKRRLDAAGMLVLLERHPIALAVIEAVGPMPRQGVVSTFRLCVQVRLMCSAGVSPAGVRAEAP
jgi:hypothetical protein